MQQDQPQKIVMLGEGRVGKTSLTIRYCRDQFDDAQESSINATCLEKVVPLESGKSIKLAIWDTAGQEIFHAMQPMYYRDAMGAVLVYDVTYKESFLKVEKWIEELKQFGKPDIEIVIAGNKCDMKNSIQIDQREVDEYAKKVGAKHFQTSAKANVGIDQLFKSLANSIHQISHFFQFYFLCRHIDQVGIKSRIKETKEGTHDQRYFQRRKGQQKKEWRLLLKCYVMNLYYNMDQQKIYILWLIAKRTYNIFLRYRN